MADFRETAERLNRVEALQNAVRHRLREESTDDIVKSAQKYFEFLQGIPTPITAEAQDRIARVLRD